MFPMLHQSKKLNRLVSTARVDIQQWIYRKYCQVAVLESNSTTKALDHVQEDVSHITPNFKEAFNIASYVNRSDTLQNLVDLNVNLSKIEKKPYLAEQFLKLDFERDMKNHIIFLNDFIDLESIGKFITKNPMIFKIELQDLRVRINYLLSKKFNEEQIKRIIENNPFWLMFSTIRIDRRFGYFQQNFELNGNEIRHLTTKQPKVITYNLHGIRTNTFVIKEEMGFEAKEIKTLLLEKPKLWMLNQSNLIHRFNFVHNTMKIPHNLILQNPDILLSRLFKIKQRHLFLEKLGRAQYNAKKENFVPLSALFKDTDTEFCKKYAKSNVDDFNMFLKTL